MKALKPIATRNVFRAMIHSDHYTDYICDLKLPCRLFPFREHTLAPLISLYVSYDNIISFSCHYTASIILYSGITYIRNRTSIRVTRFDVMNDNRINILYKYSLIIFSLLWHMQYHSDLFQKRDRPHRDDVQYSFLLFYVPDLCTPAGNKSMSLAYSPISRLYRSINNPTPTLQLSALNS